LALAVAGKAGAACRPSFDPPDAPAGGRTGNRMSRIFCAAMLVVAGTIAGLAQTTGDPATSIKATPAAVSDVIEDLAPTGTPRAAINVSNIVLARPDPAGGEPRGI
jgi:hypothetical protein